MKQSPVGLEIVIIEVEDSTVSTLYQAGYISCIVPVDRSPTGVKDSPNVAVVNPI